jgi:hypothetical protein
MAEVSRDELKKNFRNGTLVKENHFADLIDSFVHKSDNNVSAGGILGNSLIPTGKKYFSFYKDGVNQQKNLPTFSLEATQDSSQSEGVSVVVPGAAGCYKNLISFKSERDRNGNNFGRVGINTTTPALDLDVNGSVGMKSRIGRFRDPAIDPRQVVADGKWHNLITNLKGITILEVAIAVYCPEGKHAMYYGILSNAFGKGSNVKAIQQSYSSWWHRLQLQWTKARNGQYGLKVRTASAYKTKPMIYNRITNLWS